jgi:tetratricopeptide (TPR) repeat protein
VDKQIQQHAASMISNAATPASQLRQVITKIEISLGKLQISTPSELLNLPVLFDQAADLIETLEGSGANIASECARFDTVSAEYRNKSGFFLKTIGGKNELVKLRNDFSPGKEHWWWYIDEFTDEQFRLRQKKIVHTLLITIGILGVLSLIYILFLRPDKATRERFTMQNNAERALADGTPEKALAYLEQALVLNPEDEDLLILYGVAAYLSGDMNLAESSFNNAKQIIGNESVFLISRSQVYLTNGLPELAFQDAEKALEINPESAIAHYQKGLAANALGDVQTAFTELEQAATFANKEGKVELEGMARIQMAYLSTNIGVSQPSITPDN